MDNLVWQYCGFPSLLSQIIFLALIVPMDEICSLLLELGYFRARIKISDLDKVIGGLSFCLLTINNDFEILNIMNITEINIGKKLKICEKIIFYLEEIKCPFALEPHQIQGLDHDNILNVMKWLKVLVLEKRIEKRSEYERYAHYIYRKYRSFPTNHWHSVNYLTFIHSRYFIPQLNSINSTNETYDSINKKLKKLNLLIKDESLYQEIKTKLEVKTSLEKKIEDFKRKCELKMQRIKEELNSM